MKKKILILSLVVITGFGLLASTVKARTVKTKGKVDFTYPDTPAEWATAFNVLDQGMSAGKVALMFIGEPFIWQGLVSINPDIKIAFHSDGYIEPIIPDFIEIGLDILNPVQPKSMDPARLKKLYGDKLTFWGCVDIQEVLPFGTPEDVEQEVKLRIETVGKGGGLLLAPAHNIQPQVTIENILAFYRAARKYGKYLLAG